MDSLLRKVKKTPNNSSPKNDNGGAVRHEKLGEGWGENKQPVAEDEGVVFYLKYLGFTLMDEADDDESYGDGASTKAVQRIVAMAKSEGKKLRKVALKVSSKGILMMDIITKEVLSDVSIYRISFCTADKNHDKVFAFIARNTINETMVCHAFLCAKSKIGDEDISVYVQAQAVTLTVWQAFNVAQDRWTEQQNKKAARTKDNTCNKPQQCPQSSSPLIDLMDMQSTQCTTNQHSAFITPPTSSPFKDSFADYKPSQNQGDNGVHGVNDKSAESESDEENLEDSFSKLAETRSRPRIPSCSTDLRQEDVDDGVQQYMGGHRCYEEFSRQKSIDDLLSI